jgi:hypothetical protein
MSYSLNDVDNYIARIIFNLLISICKFNMKVSLSLRISLPRAYLLTLTLNYDLDLGVMVPKVICDTLSSNCACVYEVSSNYL